MDTDDALISPLAELPERDVIPLLEESEREGFRFVRRVLDEWRCGANRFTGRGEVLFGAWIEETLVGLCGLMQDPYQDRPEVGRLRNLYVLPAYRSHGIGAALTRAVIDAARTSFDTLRLRAGTAGAARLYERLGFSPVAEMPDCTHLLQLAKKDR
jgi:GNAT superfamily N-acetyltransferase